MLQVSEIFYSIQGESSYAGLPCVFIRLAGCNLRCTYCDTHTAYSATSELSIAKIINKIRKYKCNLVEITGGEPLLQSETPQLARQLINNKYNVLIETNGTLDIAKVPPPVIRIMDIKCPYSGETSEVNWSNISKLVPTDEVKFVLASRPDFDWALNVVRKHRLTAKCNVLFSPVYEVLNADQLAQWILESQLPIRIQLQLHKILSIT